MPFHVKYKYAQFHLCANQYPSLEKCEKITFYKSDICKESFKHYILTVTPLSAPSLGFFTESAMDILLVTGNPLIALL